MQDPFLVSMHAELPSASYGHKSIDKDWQEAYRYPINLLEQNGLGVLVRGDGKFVVRCSSSHLSSLTTKLALGTMYWLQPVALRQDGRTYASEAGADEKAMVKKRCQ